MNIALSEQIIAAHLSLEREPEVEQAEIQRRELRRQRELTGGALHALEQTRLYRSFWQSLGKIASLGRYEKATKPPGMQFAVTDFSPEKTIERDGRELRVANIIHLKWGPKDSLSAKIDTRVSEQSPIDKEGTYLTRETAAKVAMPNRFRPDVGIKLLTPLPEPRRFTEVTDPESPLWHEVQGLLHYFAISHELNRST